MKRFFEGIIRAFDLFGVYHKPPIRSFKTDGEAIRSYWKSVGNYMRSAMK